MITSRSLAALFAGMLLASCAHTNNLKDFPVQNSKVQFTQRISGDAARAGSDIYTGPGLAGVVGAVGNAALSVEIAQKLDRAARPEMMASDISKHMQAMVGRYLQAMPEDAGAFIFETELEEYSINCSSSGVQVHAKAYCRLIETATGRLVWDDWESESVALTTNVAGAILANTTIGAAVGVVQCAQLLEMSDEDLRRALQRAAGEVAFEIAETLREDVADMHEK